MTTAVFNYVDVDEPVDGLTSQQVNKLTCQLVNSSTYNKPTLIQSTLKFPEYFYPIRHNPGRTPQQIC